MADLIEQKFRDMFAARLRMSENGPNGSVWEVVVIEAGQSLNGFIYPASTLQEAAGVFEGVPIYAYQLGEKVDHAPEKVARGMAGMLTANLVGQIKNVRWDAKQRSLIAEAHIDDDGVRSKLLNSWKRGERGFLGLSIDADGIRSGQNVMKIERAGSVDLVSNPAAGGRFLRLVASCSGMDLREAEFSQKQWDGSDVRFDIEQLSNAVPAAVLEWAKEKAKEEDREVTKGDLKLPFKDPDGTVNANGVRSALAAIGGARGGVDLPEDVKARAKEELEGVLETIRLQNRESVRRSWADEGYAAMLVTKDGVTPLSESAILCNGGTVAVDPMQAIASIVKRLCRENLSEEQENLVKQIEAVAVSLGADVAEDEPATAQESDQMENNAEEADVSETIKTQEQAAPAPTIAPTIAPADTVRESAPATTEAQMRAELALERERSEHEKTKASLSEAQRVVESLNAKIKDQALDFALQREAVELEIVDVDAAAKLLDASGIDVAADGKVSGLRESLERLIESRPWLKKAKPEPHAQTTRMTESIQGAANAAPASVIRTKMERAKARALKGDTDAVVEYRNLSRHLNAQGVQG